MSTFSCARSLNAQGDSLGKGGGVRRYADRNLCSSSLAGAAAINRQVEHRTGKKTYNDILHDSLGGTILSEVKGCERQPTQAAKDNTRFETAGIGRKRTVDIASQNPDMNASLGKKTVAPYSWDESSHLKAAKEAREGGPVKVVPKMEGRSRGEPAVHTRNKLLEDVSRFHTRMYDCQPAKRSLHDCQSDVVDGKSAGYVGGLGSYCDSKSDNKSSIHTGRDTKTVMAWNAEGPKVGVPQRTRIQKKQYNCGSVVDLHASVVSTSRIGSKDPSRIGSKDQDLQGIASIANTDMKDISQYVRASIKNASFDDALHLPDGDAAGKRSTRGQQPARNREDLSSRVLNNVSRQQTAMGRKGDIFKSYVTDGEIAGQSSISINKRKVTNQLASEMVKESLTVEGCLIDAANVDSASSSEMLSAQMLDAPYLCSAQMLTNGFYTAREKQTREKGISNGKLYHNGNTSKNARLPSIFYQIYEHLMTSLWKV